MEIVIVWMDDGDVFVIKIGWGIGVFCWIVFFVGEVCFVSRFFVVR